MLELNEKPNEIWETLTDNLVMIVEHPIHEIKGRHGFIWYDKTDNNLNFSPVRNQLVKRSNMSVASWGKLMAEKIAEEAAKEPNFWLWWPEDPSGKSFPDGSVL